jgi:sulfur-oxidizing protein SoxZ
MARALVNLVPPAPKPGEIVEIRTLIAHPMETGQRSDGRGGLVARDVIRRIECRYDGVLVFAADLHAAIAANPLVSFSTVAVASGTLTLTWTGDNGFAQTETVALTVA